MADASLVFSILGVDKASDVLDGIASKLGGFGKVAVGALAAAAAGTVGAVAALYDVGATFDDLSDTIRTGTGATGDALDGLVDVAKNVGKNVPVEIDKIGPVVADLNTRLGLTGAPLEALSAQFLNLGHILGTEVDIPTATKAIAQFTREGIPASDAMDQLFRISQATGVGFNDLTGGVEKYGFAMTQLGFSSMDAAAVLGNLDKAGIDAEGVMNLFSRGLATAAKQGEDGAATFQRVTGEVQSLIEQGKNAEAVDMASKLFGTKGAVKFVEAVNTGKLAVGDLANVTGLSGDTINGVAADTADFAEQWQLFKNRALIALEPVATRVFGAFGDGMKWFNEVGSPALQRFADVAAEKLAPAVDWVADVMSTRIVPAVVEFGNFVRTTVIPAVADFGGWLQKYQGWLIPIAAGITAVYTAVKLYHGVVKVITTVTKIWTAVQAALNAVMAMNPIALIALAIIGLVAAFVVAYQRSETFRDIVNAVFTAVRDVVVAVITTVKDVIMGVWNWINDNWPLLLAIITGPIGLAVLVITSYWDEIKGAFTAVKDWIGARIDDVVGFFSAIPGRVGGFFSSVWDSIQSGASNAAGWVGRQVDSIVGFFTGLPGRITSAVAGLFDGIWDNFRGVVNKLISGWNNLELGFDGFTVSIPMAPDIHVPGFHIGTPNIPLLAEGGKLATAGAVIVGDDGPELLNLPRGAQVTPLNSNDRSPMGDVTVNVYESDTPEATGMAVVRRLAARQA